MGRGRKETAPPHPVAMERKARGYTAAMVLPFPAPVQSPTDMPIAPGPFRASRDSLRANRFPRWFTDGKLGIWAHWGPQSVPMRGDWYARQMYVQGGKDYHDNLETRGHPSRSGYKDVIPLWKAERWDPNRLMKLYKRAGARYFVSMAVHHDNFDLWNSKGHRWNAVGMGPHRDIVAEWQAAARKEGLRFGVSEHLGASWTWFQPAHGADKDGPLAGVPYDGANPAYADLYHPPALTGDTGWYTTDPRWHREWFDRIKDLLDQHRPDLLYTDGGLPFGTYGEAIVAHLYNLNREAVYTCKEPGEGRWAQDVERGVLGGIQPYPWQTDTSIGDWFYDRDWKYRDAAWVIHTLVDVVSKNGNLLINVVQRPDGSLDAEAERILADMADWMRTNGESIYGTHPWVAYGEGPTRAQGGAFKEDFAFTAHDIRYAAKGEGTVYATLMGRPEGFEFLLRAFAKGPNDTAGIAKVRLLGAKGPVGWRQDAEGLHVSLPKGERSAIASVLRIDGKDLRGFRAIPSDLMGGPPATVEPDADGTLRLTAGLAATHGSGIAVETREGRENLGFWDRPEDEASWSADLRPGRYEATASVAAIAPSSLALVLGDEVRTAHVAPTGDWARFADVSLGRFEVAKGGKTTLTVRSANPATWKAVNLREIVLRRIG